MTPRTPTTLAVLGGGQLGRMLGLAARPLGLDVRFLDPKADACAAAIGPLVVGALDDVEAIDRVAAGADVVTFEWGGVPAASARHAARHAPVRPGDRALEVSQDRVTEKLAFRSVGIPTADFADAATLDELRRGLATVGVPAVVKTRRGGYDGKGQVVVRDLDDAEHAWSIVGGVPSIVEAWVPFDRELSIVVARALDGEVRAWPLAENQHEGGILRRTTAPAPDASSALQTHAEALATALLHELDYVGVMCIELFDVGGELLANELAPRVHNSGHWTIDAAVTSQFENHVRAVCGLPLGATDATGVAVMINCLGSVPSPPSVLRTDGVHLHDYAKDPAPKRKVGHVTVVRSSYEQARAVADEVERVVRAAEQPPGGEA
jgi:5-(carboxyamino)imidazole ribonucleotide synthase